MTPRKPRLEPTFRVTREGTPQVLGDLEAAIMETLWALAEPATVTEVQRALPGDPRAYHTITTVMTRLCEKRLLRRRKRSDVWHYAPTLTREEFQSQVAHQVVTGLLNLAPEAAINSMLDVLDASDPEALDQLARLIEEKKRARGR
jgi:predicted transcriptional regulator